MTIQLPYRSRSVSTRWLHSAAVATAIVISTGCSDPADTPPQADAGISPTCLEADNHSDLAWIQDNIFTPSCAKFSSCHSGTAIGAAGLNLESGNSELNMVNQPSALFSQYNLVTPGDPANSYLLIIMGAYTGPLTAKGTMPLNNSILCDQKLAAVERWINSL